jgi:TRAP-type C4-dicarboxylate transport system substrate-binding protein
MRNRREFVYGSTDATLGAPLAAQAQQASGYKPEFQMSVNVSDHTTWGKAAIRLADAIRFRTGGRIRIKGCRVGCFWYHTRDREF